MEIMTAQVLVNELKNGNKEITAEMVTTLPTAILKLVKNPSDKEARKVCGKFSERVIDAMKAALFRKGFISRIWSSGKIVYVLSSAGEEQIKKREASS